MLTSIMENTLDGRYIQLKIPLSKIKDRNNEILYDMLGLTQKYNLIEESIDIHKILSDNYVDKIPTLIRIAELYETIKNHPMVEKYYETALNQPNITNDIKSDIYERLARFYSDRIDVYGELAENNNMYIAKTLYFYNRAREIMENEVNYTQRAKEVIYKKLDFILLMLESFGNFMGFEAISYDMTDLLRMDPHDIQSKKLCNEINDSYDQNKSLGE